MANGGDAISRRFELLKKRASQGDVARAQQEEDVLKRAEARSGMAGSGVFLKQRQLASEARGREQAERGAMLDIAEQEERGRAEEIEKQRAFQRGEREASQAFAAEQAGIGREFAKGERMAGQEFQAAEALKQRGFSRELFDIQQAFQEKAQRIQQSQFSKQMKFAAEQFEFDKEITKWNQDMAEKAFNKPTLMESWFQSLGLDPRSGGSLASGVGGVFGGGRAPVGPALSPMDRGISGSLGRSF